MDKLNLGLVETVINGYEVRACVKADGWFINKRFKPEAIITSEIEYRKNGVLVSEREELYQGFLNYCETIIKEVA